MRVAVDAMGGDQAPEVVIQGAIRAVDTHKIQVILVGDQAVIEEHLLSKGNVQGIKVHHADEAVTMDEPPLMAVRHKKRSSIKIAFELIKKKEADAVVSAGNSGAILTAGILTVGRIKGVGRPAIAGVFPGQRSPVILIDVGANVDCKPSHLLEFALMAEVYASVCLGIQHPKVGLLSIGEEGGKGNELVRAARPLFEKKSLNFVGNVEGRDIFKGNVEIIVCDGFVGNVALKLSEGMADAVRNMLERELKASSQGMEFNKMAEKALDRFYSTLDYEAFGGAPLLGLNGVCVVCHGDASPRAISNAIGLAAKYVDVRLVEKIALKMKGYEVNGSSNLMNNLEGNLLG